MFKKSQNQNFSLLDCIISQIQPNPKVTEFMQITNSTQQCSRLQQDTCSKHGQKKGDYYEPEYPWVKYCEGCALNLALCGKKIEKSLNSQQMVNKIKLCDALFQISQAIKLSEQGMDEYSFLSSELQQFRQYFASILGQVDGLISQLTEIRNHLQEKVQQNINREIKDIFERQSLFVSKKIQLVNEKSRIECGFVELIGKENQQETIAAIKQAKQLVSQAESLIATEQYKAKLSDNIKSVERFFDEKLSQIKQLEINLPLNESKSLNQTMRMSVAFSNRVTNYRGSKTQQAMTDDISYEQGKRMLTACSTVHHSGLVTPCQMTHKGQLNPLGELSQNRKISRTALQLKARCRSRSGQKKLQVNVRQNLENAVKKKLI